jgi:hypothetical protein
VYVEGKIDSSEGIKSWASGRSDGSCSFFKLAKQHKHMNKTSNELRTFECSELDAQMNFVSFDMLPT